MDDTRKKMLLSRRNFLKLGGGLTLTAMLAACGAPAGSSTAPTSAPATGGEAPAATEAPAAAVPEATPEPTVGIAEYGSGEATVFWHGLGGADGKTMVSMLETYAKDNGAVRSETYDWNVFYQKLPTSVVAGTPPDMAIMHEWAMQQFASQGLLQPVDDIFFGAGLIAKDDFNPGLIQTISYDGKVMGVPFDNHGWGLFYNTKLITDAGLDPNNLPKNGAEFLTWADKLTVDEAGKHPSEDGFDPDRVKQWAIHASWQRFTMPSTLWQFGGGIISDDGKTALLNSEGSVAAIQFWHDLMYKHRVCPPAVPGTPPGGDLYKTNSLAFWWDGSWSLNFFKDNPDVEAVTKAGFLNSLAPDGKQSAKMASHVLVVPVGVKDQGLERAKKLVTWLSDNGKTWATSGQVPARLSVQEDPDVQGIWSVKAFAEQFKAIGRTDVPHVAATEIQTAWEAAVSGALANTTPVQEALNEGNQQIQSILDRG
jgi:ABC-type glycerol-3-phosphate transport system substrate-binding protein